LSQPETVCGVTETLPCRARSCTRSFALASMRRSASSLCRRRANAARSVVMDRTLGRRGGGRESFSFVYLKVFLSWKARRGLGDHVEVAAGTIAGNRQGGPAA